MVVILGESCVQIVFVAPLSYAKIHSILVADANGLIDPIGVRLHGPEVGFSPGGGVICCRAHIRQPDVSGAAVVFPSLLAQGQVGFRVHHIGTRSSGADASARAKFERRALLSALGRDEDDAVGAARTVNASSRRVLEDFNGFDVVGIDGGQRIVVEGAAVAAEEVLLGDGDAIDNVQRISSC